MGPAIQVIDVVKRYPLGAGGFTAIDRLSFDIAQGEFVAIVGRSGSGKTTLLNLLAGIDRPTSGTVHVAGADLGSLSESGLAGWRGRNVGLVFQSAAAHADRRGERDAPDGLRQEDPDRRAA